MRREASRRLTYDALESGADPASVGELVIDGHALKEKGRPLREESKEAFEGLLTPEQKRKLEMLEAARAADAFRGPRGKMGPRGGASGFRGMGHRRGDWDPRGLGQSSRRTIGECPHVRGAALRRTARPLGRLLRCRIRARVPLSAEGPRAHDAGDRPAGLRATVGFQAASLQERMRK